MSGFVTDLDSRLLPSRESTDAPLWKLLAPLIFDSAMVGTITVPTGFETDFASVIRLPIAYSLFGDTAHRAATVHDYLYTTGVFERSIADQVFLEAMESTGIPWWRRWAMYSAARMFGAEYFAGCAPPGGDLPRI